MCQLTFTYFNTGDIALDLKLAQTYVEIQSFVNSLKVNKDGFGVFSRGGQIFKTEKSASIITNLGKILCENINTIPVISHVRNATFTNGIKSIDKENSHPFGTDKIVVAHNGSLETVDSLVMKEDRFKGMIDSHIFTEILSDNYDKSKSFPETLKSVMESFYGKFALMICDKTDGNFYIARGKTAELYRFDIKILIEDVEIPIGFIINTDKECLSDAMVLFMNIAKIGENLDIIYRLNLLSEIKKETLYIFKDNDIVECGEIIENTKVVETKVWEKDYQRGDWFSNNRNANKPKTESQKYGDTITEFMNKFRLSIYDIDLLFYGLFHKPLSGINVEDADIFTKEIIPFLTEMGHKNKVKEWKYIVDHSGGYGSTYTYTKLNLKFPYMMNDINTLRDVRRRLKEELSK